MFSVYRNLILCILARYIVLRYIISRNDILLSAMSKNQRPLSPAVFHILMALADRARHGYGIMQEVKARTEGQVVLMPGTLYGAIKRLLERGMVAEEADRVDEDLGDERRRYYRLTNVGMKVLRAEVARLNSLVVQAREKKLLQEPSVRIQGAGR